MHFALENDGWNCTFECEVHVSASFGVRKVIPGTSGGAESFSSGSGRGEAGGESAFCGRFADPRPVVLREPFFRERVGFQSNAHLPPTVMSQDIGDSSVSGHR